MRYAYVEFMDPASVKIALKLNNIQLLDKALVIQEATKANVQTFDPTRLLNPSTTLSIRNEILFEWYIEINNSIL
jgi:hypothetical protein